MLKIVIIQRDNFQLSPFSRNLFNLASELQALNCSVTLLTTSEEGINVLPQGVIGRVLGAWVPRWLRLPIHYLAIPQLILYILQERPDCIIARGVSFAVPTVIARIITGKKLLVITTLHVSISGDLNNRIYRSTPILKRLARFCINRSDHVVAVSSGIADDYSDVLGLDRKHFQVIYNPVVTPNIHLMAAEGVDEPWLSADREHATLLHVGRFAPEKDHETLLRAFAAVCLQRDARLLLIGDGPLRSSIEKRINDLGLVESVKLLGRQNNPFAYMARADGLILSSKYEGLPGVLIQALAVGCNVVATNVSGAAEILDGGRFGPICQIGNVKQLSEEILSILRSPLERSLLMSRGKEFSAASSAAKYFKLMRSVTK